LLWGDDGGLAGPLPDSGSENKDGIRAATLIDAARQVDDLTVFEKRRLLRQAADALWNRREEQSRGEDRFCGTHDLDQELRLIAQHILRTPLPLVRLALWEAARALDDLQRPAKAPPLAH
jgi:hypothetical protein